MVNNNHYETLKVSPNASQAEIKQAYRRLVKQYHPDSNQKTADSEQIIRINAAYEVLGDAENRQSYDRRIHNKLKQQSSSRQQRSTAAGQQYQTKRQTGRDIDDQIEEWLRQVYQPTSRLAYVILYSLKTQIEKLAADPFDDELLEDFQDYCNCLASSI
jgi:molecular chaperone DnaJ